MKIIPAVDVKEGRCVQLVGGDPERERYSGDAVAAARRWVSRGARILHVVNLDGAFGEDKKNLGVIRDVLDEAEFSHVGGGVRDMDYARRLIELGADRLVVGTRALEEEFMEKLRDEFSSYRLIGALDCSGGEVLTQGWKESSGVRLEDAAKMLEGRVWGLLYTDVDREGRMEGVASGEVADLVDWIDAPVIASGGVSTLEDVEALRDAGAWGAVVGSALYEGKFTLKEARGVAA